MTDKVKIIELLKHLHNEHLILEIELQNNYCFIQERFLKKMQVCIHYNEYEKTIIKIQKIFDDLGIGVLKYKEIHNNGAYPFVYFRFLNNDYDYVLE